MQYSQDGRWYWDGYQWRPVMAPKPKKDHTAAIVLGLAITGLVVVGGIGVAATNGGTPTPVAAVSTPKPTPTVTVTEEPEPAPTVTVTEQPAADEDDAMLTVFWSQTDSSQRKTLCQLLDASPALFWSAWSEAVSDNPGSGFESVSQSKVMRFFGAKCAATF